MTIEIDPYEAIVTLALDDTGLTDVVSTRIDIWHRYGQDTGDWATNLQSLVFVPQGGAFHVENHGDSFCRPILEARCYGDSPYDCAQVWKALMAFTGQTLYRRTDTITSGKALVNYIHPVPGSGMPQLLFDEDIRPNGGMPFYSVQLVAKVATAAVT